MFAKFNDTVKKDKIDKIPKEILDSYNAKIPDNVCAQYVDKHDGTCELVTTTDASKTQVTVTVPSATLVDKVPDDIRTQKELEDYMYRTQKTLHYRVEGKPYMKINGFKVFLEDFVKRPFDDHRLGPGSDLYIVPPKFPKLKPLLLDVGKTKLELKVERIPDERKNVIVLKTDENYWLQIKLELSNIKDEPSRIEVNCDFSNCKTVSDLLSAFKIKNALASGKYSLSYMGIHIPLPLKNPVPTKMRQFWEKAEKLEKILDVRFVPNVESYQQDIFSIQRLFQCLVLKSPFSSFINEGSQTGLHTDDREAFDANIGKPMALAYVEEHHWEVLGASFETYDLCCIFDAVIEDVTEDSVDSDKPYFAHLSPVEGKKMKLVTYIATNEEEISRFQRQFDSHNDLLKYMLEAKTISK